MRQSDPQAARRRFHAPPVRLPQTGRRRVEQPARPIGESLQRPVLQPARLLDAAARREGVRNYSPAECRRQADGESGAEADQNRGVQEAGQNRQDIEQAKYQKHAQRSERRPARRPDPLPQQGKAGETQPHRQAATG